MKNMNALKQRTYNKKILKKQQLTGLISSTRGSPLLFVT